MGIKVWGAKMFIKGKLPNFIYRFIGRKLAKAIKLEEGNMETKKWYQSKTILTAIVGVILGAIQPISDAFGHPIVIPDWVYQVLAGFGLYSLRVGDKKVG